MSSPKEVLQTYWNYENFRPNQEAIINRVLENQDTIETITLKLNKKLELMIKKKPEEWIWTHNRWK